MKTITMPSMGADMTEGTLEQWLKKEGDKVARGETIAEIGTDKTVVEMESYDEGTLRKILVPKGAVVQVGEPIALIGSPDESLPDVLPSKGISTETSKPEVVQKDEQDVLTPSLAEAVPVPDDALTALSSDKNISSFSDDVSGDRVKASPIARRLAREMNIDIDQVNGTGPGGRVTKEDVLTYVPSSPPVASGIVAGAVSSSPSRNIKLSDIEEPLSNMRKAIARVTSRSKSEAPHFYVSQTVDMTSALEVRKGLNEAVAGSGDKISINDMILASVVAAIVKYPRWNSTYSDGVLKGNADVNVGVAIALEQGLIVPAIMHAQNMTLVELSRAAKDLGRRTRGEGGSLSQEELTKGTFSTSNLGMFGADSFAAIIVPPQSAILSVGKVGPMPAVKEDELTVRQLMNATLSADHRVGDGAEAAMLLNEIKRRLETPMLLLM